MSTFMGAAWLYLAPGADPKAVVEELYDFGPDDLTGGFEGRFIALSCGYGYHDLPDTVVGAMESTGQVSHAVLALDHDEYGAEHIVLAMRKSSVRRLQHVYIYPWNGRAGEFSTDEGEPSLTEIPPYHPPAPPAFTGVLVDGPAAHATLAQLFDVPVERVAAATAAGAEAHQELGSIGMPFQPWHQVLGIPWDDEDLDDENLDDEVS